MPVRIHKARSPSGFPSGESSTIADLANNDSRSFSNGTDKGTSSSSEEETSTED